MFPARAKRKMERVYTSIDRIIKIAGQFSRKCLLLSVIFTQFLIIYSWSLLFVVDSRFPSARFFVRWNRKKKKERNGGKKVARERVEYIFPFITGFRKYARLWKRPLVFKVFRDLAFQKGAMNSLASILLRRAVLRHWDVQNENSRWTWKLEGRPPPSSSRSSCKKWPFIRFPDDICRLTWQTFRNVQKRFDYIIKLSCKSM